jgi:hypothetical protein
MKRFFCFIVVFLLLASCAGAGEITLAWDPSASDGVTGYKIHVGTASRSYVEIKDVGNVLTYKVDKLEMGKEYFFAATAYDAEGNESGFSNEVSGLPSRTVRTLIAPVLRIL